MSFTRNALMALFTGSVAGALILTLVLSQPQSIDEARATLPRFAVLVSPASAALLDDPAVDDHLNLLPLTSSDGLVEELTRLDADGIILDRATVTQMTTAAVASLLRSGRVIVTIGVDMTDMGRLAGFHGSFSGYRWPRPYFSVLLYLDNGSWGTNWDYSPRPFVGFLTGRAKQARAASATPAAGGDTNPLIP